MFPRWFALSILLFTLALASPHSLRAQNNWPNWRGPNYDGSLPDANPPVEWSATKNVRWKVPLPGKGSGSPIIWNDQIILLTAIGQESNAKAEPPAKGGKGGRGGMSRPVPTSEFEFVVTSRSLKDGSELWKTTLHKAIPHEGGHHTNTYASSSAVTDGKHIFASFGSNGIYCLDMKGQVLWSKHLGKMQTRNQFGEGSSPALVQGSLIVPWDHEADSKLFALDAATGDVRWEAKRQEPTTWATPLAVEHAGKTQIVTNGTTVRSYDLDSGDLLWSCGGQVTNPIPSPVRFGDQVICMTGYRGNAIYALPVDAKGDISNSPNIRWHNHEAATYVASPVLYKGRLYLTKERSGVMTSLDAATGKVIIPQTRLSQIQDIYASPVAAADRIYFTGRDGTAVVIRHGDKLEELAVNSLGEAVDASPAIVGNALVIRGAENLYLLGE